MSDFNSPEELFEEGELFKEEEEGFKEEVFEDATIDGNYFDELDEVGACEEALFWFDEFPALLVEFLIWFVFELDVEMLFKSFLVFVVVFLLLIVGMDVELFWFPVWLFDGWTKSDRDWLSANKLCL